MIVYPFLLKKFSWDIEKSVYLKTIMLGVLIFLINNEIDIYFDLMQIGRPWSTKY